MRTYRTCQSLQPQTISAFPAAVRIEFLHNLSVYTRTVDRGLKDRILLCRKFYTPHLC